MKKLLSLLVAVMMLPVAFAVSIGSGIGVDIQTEDFAPRVWMCDSRIVYDDATEPGRISEDGQKLVERINNYAFEGEQLQWKVLVLDKNGIEKIEDVFASVGPTQGEGNDIEANCMIQHILGKDEQIDKTCNARILEEKLHKPGYDNVAAYYLCTLTVETPASMYGSYWITVEAVDLDGLSGTMDENEFWYLNPIIALAVDGTLTFEDVRPGTSSYSDTLLVGNDADDGSGVMMDMFISGTDFYDSASSGAKCPVSNQLELNRFSYFATNGAYSTHDDLVIDAVDGDRAKDNEGYVNIEYGVGFNDPKPFYNNAEILQAVKQGPYYAANVLAPGAEMAITFRLNLPEPCNGDFDTGSIYFWGEAI
jgi:hypothetical protein